jgi:DNA-binding response OmpR family regulator
MQAQQAHPGVILLTQNLSSADLGSVRAWFEESEFNLCEASDVFQAIERLSDFTEASRPDVVLLEANCPDIDFAIIRELAADANAGGEASVFSFTHGSEAKSVSKELDAIFQDMTICH